MSVPPTCRDLLRIWRERARVGLPKVESQRWQQGRRMELGYETLPGPGTEGLSGRAGLTWRKRQKQLLIWAAE